MILCIKFKQGQLFLLIEIVMRNSQSQKKRFSIFKNNLFSSGNASFNKIPYHFDFNPTVTCVIDHTNQTINTYHSKFKKQKHSNSKNKIFDQRRTISEQKSCLSSIQQTSRCGSVCGERNRNHSIFNKSTKPKFQSQKDLASIKEDQQEVKVSMVKTQSYTQKVPTHLNKNGKQMKQFYLSEMENKLKFNIKETISPQRLISQESVGYSKKNEMAFDILKPEQFARMLKQVRITSKIRRNQNGHRIPRLLSQVPERPPKEGLVYRI